jgi:excisionase family DNA binding protein
MPLEKSLSRKRIASDKDFLLELRAMKFEEDKLLSTADVAAQLGVTRQRVLELITGERLPAIKVGRSYVVRAADVSSLELGKVGRPPKSSNGAATPKRPKKGGRK